MGVPMLQHIIVDTSLSDAKVVPLGEEKCIFIIPIRRRQIRCIKKR